MKVTFVLPGIGKKAHQPYIGTWKMEPLMMAVLQGLTPPDVETELFDDRLELIDYDTPTDLAAITVETYTARRAYMIAGRFRERGVPVVLGGYHVTLLPEEASAHADAIVVGNAEQAWPRLLADFQQGHPQRVYVGEPGYAAGLPDRRIFRGKRYLPISLVETGRGCGFRCQFCAISSYYCARYYPRPVRQIVDDVIATGNRYFFLADDNIAAQPHHLLALAKELAPLGIYWASQGSLTLARQPELLAWLRKSGCVQMLIGFESLDDENLAQMGKSWLRRLGEWDDLVNRIHDAGISIYATFLFGFDHDTPASFERALEFALKHEFFFAAFNHLLAFPGTPLYKRLQQEGRLLHPAWWLDENFRYGEIALQPRLMDAAEVSERCAQARRDFFRFPVIARRGLAQLHRNASLPLVYTFLAQNVNLRGEVGGKLGLPLGEGLDELPK
jgi:radical SAM superfamily enzyme YgiQ (UPF0313 family)